MKSPKQRPKRHTRRLGSLTPSSTQDGEEGLQKPKKKKNIAREFSDVVALTGAKLHDLVADRDSRMPWLYLYLSLTLHP